MSATAKVHGMDGKLVEPDWPSLTLDELRILFASTPLWVSRFRSSP